MANYDPLYPVYAEYEVGQQIWDLHEIDIWQLLIGLLGKRKTFSYLQYRYEMLPRFQPVLMLAIVVFVLSWIVLLANDWYQSKRTGHQLVQNRPTLKQIVRKLMGFKDDANQGNNNQAQQQNQLDLANQNG